MNEPHIWRAYARYNPVNMNVSIVIGRPGHDGAQYLTELGSASRFATFEHRDYADNGPPPELHISEDIAKALLEALAGHFGGTEDTRTLRKDYLAERARVDKFIDRVVKNGSPL